MAWRVALVFDAFDLTATTPDGPVVPWAAAAVVIGHAHPTAGVELGTEPPPVTTRIDSLSHV